MSLRPCLPVRVPVCRRNVRSNDVLCWFTLQALNTLVDEHCSQHGGLTPSAIVQCDKVTKMMMS